jgi:hypothetical protein
VPRSIECQYTTCRVKFKPRGNQRYHSRECARKGRRVKDRLRKRTQRHKEYTRRIEQGTEAPESRTGAKFEEQAAVPVRNSPDRRLFFIAVIRATS